MRSNVSWVYLVNWISLAFYFPIIWPFLDPSLVRPFNVPAMVPGNTICHQATHYLGHHTHVGKQVWICCGSGAECSRRQLSMPRNLWPCRNSGDRKSVRAAWPLLHEHRSFQHLWHNTRSFYARWVIVCFCPIGKNCIFQDGKIWIHAIMQAIIVWHEEDLQLRSAFFLHLLAHFSFLLQSVCSLDFCLTTVIIYLTWEGMSPLCHDT